MKTTKNVLIVCGIIVTIWLIYNNLSLRKLIRAQTAAIMNLEQAKSDTIVLKEYKKNFNILKSKTNCNSKLDSMFNSSDFLQTK